MASAEPAQTAPRSCAQERRLRRRRQEARIRLRLVADAAILAGHHASSPPRCQPPQPVSVTQGELADLREEVRTLRAQLAALQARVDSPPGVLAEDAGSHVATKSVSVVAAAERLYAAMDTFEESPPEETQWRVVGVKGHDDVLSCQHVFARKSFASQRARALRPSEVINARMDGVDEQGARWVRLVHEDGFVAIATVDSRVPGLPTIEGRLILEPEGPKGTDSG